jgi:uncharacterized hydantoinase/oxoprolinase family protein
MSWNYRIFKRIHNHKYLHEPETLYEIRETYYDEDGSITMWAEIPDIISDNLEGVRWTLQEMMEACNKPVIDYNTKQEVNRHSPPG